MRAGLLPKRVPVGTKYVIEGKRVGQGEVHVFSRYLVFPDGRCFDLPPDDQAVTPHPAAIARRQRQGLSQSKKH